MKKLWLLLAFFMVAVTLCSPPRFGGVKVAAQSVVPPCGIAYWTPVPGEPLQSSTLGGELSHLESCAASAVPGNVPTPIATGCITITGSSPYTIGCNAVVATPSPLASGCIVISGAYPYTIACATATPAPTPSPNASAPISIDNVWPYYIGINNGNCLDVDVSGNEEYSCATPGPQATPSPTAAGCGTVTGAWPYTVDTTACSGTVLSTNNTWTGTNLWQNHASVEYNSSTVCGTNGFVSAEFCAIGTSTVGIAIGPLGGTWNAAGTSNSQQLVFCRDVGGTVSCPESMTMGSGGTFTIGGAPIVTNNQSFSAGTAKIIFGQDVEGAACAIAVAGPTAVTTGAHGCKLTFTSISSMQLTWTSYTTHSLCFSQDETTTNGSKVTACSVSGATITATSGDVVDFYFTGF